MGGQARWLGSKWWWCYPNANHLLHTFPVPMAGLCLGWSWRWEGIVNRLWGLLLLANQTTDIPGAVDILFVFLLIAGSSNNILTPIKSVYMERMFWWYGIHNFPSLFPLKVIYHTKSIERFAMKLWCMHSILRPDVLALSTGGFLSSVTVGVSERVLGTVIPEFLNIYNFFNGLHTWSLVWLNIKSLAHTLWSGASLQGCSIVFWNKMCFKVWLSFQGFFSWMHKIVFLHLKIEPFY